MKKGKILYFINWILVFSIPTILATTTIKTDEIAANIDVKNLKTNLLIKDANVSNEILDESTTPIVVEENKDVVSANIKDNVKTKEIVQVEKEENTQEVVKEGKENTELVEKDDQKNVLTGKLSYYKANCQGCSGKTASGYDVSDGNLYYHDATYGDVRIIAAGYELDLYSIVRIKNSSLGTDILAIVLDRGGDIGQEKKFLIDVLTNSFESKGRVEKNISLDILRNGR